MDAQDIADALSGREFTDDERASWEEGVRAMYALANDLRYPTDQHGNVYDMNALGLSPIIAWHLTMAGWRKDPDKQRRKPRPVPDYEGAIEWVSMDTPDVPPPAFDRSIADLANGTPSEKAEAIRRLGGVAPDPEPSSGWHTKTHITVEGFDD